MISSGEICSHDCIISFEAGLRNRRQLLSSNLKTEQRSFWIKGVPIGTLVYYIFLAVLVYLRWFVMSGHTEITVTNLLIKLCDFHFYFWVKWKTKSFLLCQFLADIFCPIERNLTKDYPWISTPRLGVPCRNCVCTSLAKIIAQSLPEVNVQ